MIYQSGVLNYYISDHECEDIVCKKIKVDPVKCEFGGRPYVNYDKEHFIDLLNQTDWTTTTQLTNLR